MSRSDALLKGLTRLGVQDNLQPGWFDVIDDALREDGWSLAPIRPAGTMLDSTAMDELERIWDSPETADGWNGGDAVDTIGVLLRATGRKAD